MMSLILTLICGSALVILWGTLMETLGAEGWTLGVGAVCISVICATLMTAFDVLYEAIKNNYKN